MTSRLAKRTSRADSSNRRNAKWAATRSLIDSHDARIAVTVRIAVKTNIQRPRPSSPSAKRILGLAFTEPGEPEFAARGNRGELEARRRPSGNRRARSGRVRA